MGQRSFNSYFNIAIEKRDQALNILQNLNITYEWVEELL